MAQVVAGEYVADVHEPRTQSHLVPVQVFSAGVQVHVEASTGASGQDAVAFGSGTGVFAAGTGVPAQGAPAGDVETGAALPNPLKQVAGAGGRVALRSMARARDIPACRQILHPADGPAPRR